MPPKKAAPKAKPATMKYTIDCQSLPTAKHDDDDDDWCICESFSREPCDH